MGLLSLLRKLKRIDPSLAAGNSKLKINETCQWLLADFKSLHTTEKPRKKGMTSNRNTLPVKKLLGFWSLKWATF
jgi:hypothetical protein